jgi:site-specific DNA-methyltransferase (adenine-specific)
MGDLGGEFAPQHENILYATRGRYTFPYQRPKTVLRFQRVLPDELLHPNEKPVALLVYLIAHLSKPNDLILDPFCGSGTTCVAAKKLGRRYIGIDISEEYCEIARMRLKMQKMRFKESQIGQSIKAVQAGEYSLLDWAVDKKKRKNKRT